MELFAADGHDAGGCERVTGKSGMRPIRTLVLERHIGELNEQLHGWRKEREAATCNHRRDALMNLVRVLYGKKAASGLSDLVTFRKPRAKPRWRTISDVTEVLAQLEPGTKVRARLLLLQWTGMRPSQESRLRTVIDIKLSTSSG